MHVTLLGFVSDMFCTSIYTHYYLIGIAYSLNMDHPLLEVEAILFDFFEGAEGIEIYTH